MAKIINSSASIYYPYTYIIIIQIFKKLHTYYYEENKQYPEFEFSRHFVIPGDPRKAGGAASEAALAAGISLGHRFSKANAHQFIKDSVDAQGNRVYQCKLCDMVTKFSQSINRHMVIKHTKPSETGFNCPYCQRNFSNKYYLTNHTASRTCMKNMNLMFDSQ